MKAYFWLPFAGLKVLPVLLARAALHAVSPGQSLEQAFLDASGRTSSTSTGIA